MVTTLSAEDWGRGRRETRRLPDGTGHTNGYADGGDPTVDHEEPAMQLKQTLGRIVSHRPRHGGSGGSGVLIMEAPAGRRH